MEKLTANKARIFRQQYRVKKEQLKVASSEIETVLPKLFEYLLENDFLFEVETGISEIVKTKIKNNKSYFILNNVVTYDILFKIPMKIESMLWPYYNYEDRINVVALL
ncbi:hypothetical protein FP435_00260 (plasmid) [Lactobacillus sp. PV037]|uniref:hypothetical protein n=1 Tax=Lactobacillus sp. PV037 TaxID=2594496 RepID=UPI00223FE35B|nr:hypothetical protein [Lactobacillus sp. PV037]QNQ82970.1 hypothetical protein FP435_00260 [Lactobacillus sp. PV037]